MIALKQFNEYGLVNIDMKTPCPCQISLRKIFQQKNVLQNRPLRISVVVFMTGQSRQCRRIHAVVVVFFRYPTGRDGGLP